MLINDSRNADNDCPTTEPHAEGDHDDLSRLSRAAHPVRSLCTQRQVPRQTFGQRHASCRQVRPRGNLSRC